MLWQKIKKLNAADLASLLRSEINIGEYVRMTNFQQKRYGKHLWCFPRHVREALTKLMENGLVEIKHGSGTYVTFDGKASTPNAIQSANPLELIDARFALEPTFAVLQYYMVGEKISTN